MQAGVNTWYKPVAKAIKIQHATATKTVLTRIATTISVSDGVKATKTPGDDGDDGDDNMSENDGTDLR